MKDKIALVSCSGLSPLGLIVRAASVDLALEHDNIVVACITATSAQTDKCMPIIDDCPIVSVTGCSDDCVSVIFEKQGLKVDKNIAAEDVLDMDNLNPLNSVRLDEEGEKAVKELKEYILKELEDF